MANVYLIMDAKGKLAYVVRNLREASKIADDNYVIRSTSELDPRCYFPEIYKGMLLLERKRAKSK